jgi:hypothetical protein
MSTKFHTFAVSMLSCLLLMRYWKANLFYRAAQTIPEQTPPTAPGTGFRSLPPERSFPCSCILFVVWGKHRDTLPNMARGPPGRRIGPSSPTGWTFRATTPVGSLYVRYFLPFAEWRCRSKSESDRMSVSASADDDL